MEIGFREVIELAVALFMLGGIWRDIRATQRDVQSLKKVYARDHQAIVRIIAEHNLNHDSNITAPEPNGNGG